MEEAPDAEEDDAGRGARALVLEINSREDTKIRRAGSFSSVLDISPCWVLLTILLLPVSLEGQLGVDEDNDKDSVLSVSQESPLLLLRCVFERRR